VTGGSHGIGRAIATRLGATGRRALARSFDGAQLADGVETLACDLTRSDEISSAVQQIRREGGQVEVLINNAGVYLQGPFLDSSMAAAAELVMVKRDRADPDDACLPPGPSADAGHGDQHGLPERLPGGGRSGRPHGHQVCGEGLFRFAAARAARFRCPDHDIYPGPVNTWGAESSEMLLLPSDVAEFVGAIVDTQNRGRRDVA